MLKIIDYKTAMIEKDALITAVRAHKENGKLWFDEEDIQDLKGYYRRLEDNKACETEQQAWRYSHALESIQYYQEQFK